MCSNMPTAQAITHIRVDERGVAWIERTRVKVIEIALDHIAQGWDADEIHRQHPDLSLAQIHAALAYYYDHQQALDQLMAVREREAEALRAQFPSQLRRDELRARLKSKQ